MVKYGLPPLRGPAAPRNLSVLFDSKARAYHSNWGRVDEVYRRRSWRLVAVDSEFEVKIVRGGGHFHIETHAELMISSSIVRLAVSIIWVWHEPLMACH